MGSIPVQQSAHHAVLAGSGNQESGEAGVGGGLIAQGLDQLQQVVQQLLIISALQHLYSMASHLHTTSTP